MLKAEAGQRLFWMKIDISDRALQEVYEKQHNYYTVCQLCSLHGCFFTKVLVIFYEVMVECVCIYME